MKKLLKILSMITIASSGMTGLAGNAPVKREKILKNNTEDNFLQTNNLNRIKRNKRQNNSLFSLSKYNEVKLYYDNSKKNRVLHLVDTSSKFKNHEIITLNLKKINPLDYKKIEFLGDVDSDCWGVSVRWGSSIYNNKQDGCDNSKFNRGKNIKQYLKDNNNDFHKLVKNRKVKNKDVEFNHWSGANLELQNFEVWYYSAWLGVDQFFGLNWYWENDNYYLQVIVFQQLDWRASLSSLEGWLKIGSGVRLYND